MNVSDRERLRGAADAVPPQETYDVSVVIPHLNDLERLKTCLALLDGQSVPRGRFEIIVADNGSSCGPEAVAAAIGGAARLVSVPEPGAGPARNAGAAMAHGRILAFTDSDCRPQPDWLERGLAALDKADFVGGRVVTTVEDPGRPTPAEAYEMVFAFPVERYVRAKRFLPSCSLFMKAETFKAVGGFRTEVSEDVDWCWRAQDQGFTIGYDPTIVISHPARHSWPDLVRKNDRITAELYHLGRSRGVPKWRWLLRACGLALSPLIHIWPVLRHRELRVTNRLRAGLVLVRLKLHRAGRMIALSVD